MSVSDLSKLLRLTFNTMSGKSGKSGNGSDLLGRMLKEPTPSPGVSGVAPIGPNNTPAQSTSKEASAQSTSKEKDKDKKSKSSSRSSRSRETEAGFSKILEAMEEQKKLFSTFFSGLKMVSGPCGPNPPEEPPQARHLAAETVASQESQVEDDEDPEVLDPEDDEEDPQSSGGLLERFSAGKAMFVPTEMMLQIWNRVLRHEPEYGEDAWSNLNLGALIKKWTGHPTASFAFGAPSVDPGLRPLKFQDHKELEKKLVHLQTNAGGMAAIAIRLMCLLEGSLIS